MHVLKEWARDADDTASSLSQRVVPSLPLCAKRMEGEVAVAARGASAEAGAPSEAAKAGGGNLMNRNTSIRINSVADDIAHHHQQQEPEIGPFRLAFRFKSNHG